jgi:pSer/pThr/pTyr-binding forkhead associated (FHA) protein
MIRCSFCATDNAEGTIVCIACGRILDENLTLTTRTLLKSVPSVEPAKQNAHIGKLPSRGVAVYAGQSKEPVIVEVKERVMLGRRRDMPVPELVDLAPYDAYRLGVSRNHAVLTFKGSRLYVHDAGSVNGTWLDGQRLKPYELYAIPSGAKVSLGQLVVYVYYNV